MDPYKKPPVVREMPTNTKTMWEQPNNRDKL